MPLSAGVARFPDVALELLGAPGLVRLTARLQGNQTILIVLYMIVLSLIASAPVRLHDWIFSSFCLYC